MFLHYAINRWGLQMANYDRVMSFTNESISSTKQFDHPSSTWGSIISVKDVPKYERDHLVLVTGGIYISSGELVKVCPYSSTIEMVIKGMKLPYKVVCVDFTAKKKEDWFVDIHKDGKPTTPCMRIDDEWVFDTEVILEKLRVKYKDDVQMTKPFTLLTEKFDKRINLMGMIGYAKTEKGSEKEEKAWIKVKEGLEPFIKQLELNWGFLCGPTLSLSDCHFVHQFLNGYNVVMVSKNHDIIQEYEDTLGKYFDRVKRSPAFQQSRGSYCVRKSEERILDVEIELGIEVIDFVAWRFGMQLPVLEQHRRLPCPEFVTIEDIPNLDEETLVLGVGCCYNSNGRLLKVCPYSATVEMVMYHCKIPYKLIAVNLFGKAKESWYKPLREDGKKPTTPFLYSSGKWIFETENVAQELTRRFPNLENIDMFDLKNIKSEYKALNKFALFSPFGASKTPLLGDVLNMFEPFEERLKQSKKYLNGDQLTFEDCDFVIGMRFVMLSHKYFTNTEIFMDFPHIAKFIEEIRRLPAHDIANHYHLNISTNRHQNDMEHADQAARYIVDHYGVGIRKTLYPKFPPIYEKRVIYFKNLPRLPKEVMCLTIGCEILPSTGQKIYNCRKSQAIAMAMVSNEVAFQVIEIDVNSDDNNVLQGGGTPALYSHGKWHFKLPDIFNEILARSPRSNLEHALNVADINKALNVDELSRTFDAYAGATAGSATEMKYFATICNKLNSVSSSMEEASTDYLYGNYLSFDDCHLGHVITSWFYRILVLKENDFYNNEEIFSIALKTWLERLKALPSYNASRGATSFAYKYDDIERYEQMLAETEVSRMYGYVKKKPKLEEEQEEEEKEEIIEVVEEEEVYVTEGEEEYEEYEDVKMENSVIIDDTKLNLFMNEKLAEIAQTEKRMKDQELRLKESTEKRINELEKEHAKRIKKMQDMEERLEAHEKEIEKKKMKLKNEESEKQKLLNFETPSQRPSQEQQQQSRNTQQHAQGPPQQHPWQQFQPPPQQHYGYNNNYPPPFFQQPPPQFYHQQLTPPGYNNYYDGQYQPRNMQQQQSFRPPPQQQQSFRPPPQQQQQQLFNRPPPRQQQQYNRPSPHNTYNGRQDLDVSPVHRAQERPQQQQHQEQQQDEDNGSESEPEGFCL